MLTIFGGLGGRVVDDFSDLSTCGLSTIFLPEYNRPFWLLPYIIFLISIVFIFSLKAKKIKEDIAYPITSQLKNNCQLFHYKNECY